MIHAECQQTRELLDSYLSAELLVETNHQILSHLSRCDACRTQLGRRQRVRSLMKAALAGEDPPAELVRRISRISRDVEPGGRMSRRSWPGSRWLRLGRGRDRNTHQMRDLGGGWRRQALAGAALGALLILLLAVAPWTPARLTASELLARSDQASRSVANRSDVVLHRSLKLEERRGRGGPVVARQRIEVWHIGASGMTIRRAFDERDTLVAGEWRERNGARTVYRPGSPPQRGARPIDPTRLSGLDDTNAAWRFDLSATEYASLIPAPTAARVEDAPGLFVLKYEAAPASGENRLVEATLTLRRDTLHPIEQTVVVDRQGDVREYALSEARFNALPREQVARTVFEPDAALLGSVDPVPPAPLPLLEAALPAPVVVAPARPSADSEIEAIYRLHRMDAWLRDAPVVSRTPQGDLNIAAVVDTDERRTQLIAALSTVASLPGISIDVTVDPAYPRASTRPQVPPGDLRSMAIYEPLHTRFVDFIAARVPASQRPSAEEQARLVDDLVRSVATRTLDRSHGALRRAQLLENLIDRIPGQEKNRPSPDAEATWQTMLRDHARGIEHRLEALRLELQPILPLPWSHDTGPSETAPASVNLARAAKQLTGLLNDIDAAVRRAFGPRTDGAAPVTLGDPALWRAILEAETLAAEFQRPLPLGAR